MTENQTTPASTEAEENFDLTSWLAGTDQQDITQRSHKSLTVYRHPGQLDEAIDRVRALEAAYSAELAATAGQEIPAHDLALGESAPAPAEPDSAELDAARAELSRLVESHALHITCYPLTSDESKKAVDGTGPNTPERRYCLLSESARLGADASVKASPEQWAQIHHAIGQAQINRVEAALLEAFNRDTGAEVTALFSPGS